MKTCKNCRHFNLEGTTDPYDGHCELVKVQYSHENLTESADLIYFGWGGGYDGVSVGVNFGCIHFEQK